MRNSPPPGKAIDSNFDERLRKAHEEEGAGARRRTAEHNACAGIPTEALEAGVIQRLVKLLGEYLDDMEDTDEGRSEREGIRGALAALKSKLEE